MRPDILDEPFEEIPVPKAPPVPKERQLQEPLSERAKRDRRDFLYIYGAAGIILAVMLGLPIAMSVNENLDFVLLCLGCFLVTVLVGYVWVIDRIGTYIDKLSLRYYKDIREYLLWAAQLGLLFFPFIGMVLLTYLLWWLLL